MDQFKPSLDELSNLLRAQAPEFATDMHADFDAYIHQCEANGQSVTAQDVIALAMGKIRVLNAAVANEVTSFQLEKLLAKLQKKTGPLPG